MFERCLLVEFCLLKGGDGEKEKAKAVAQNIINDQKQAEATESQYTNGNSRIKIFEAVL